MGATVRTCAHRAADPTVEPLGPPCARRAVRWGPLYGHARIGRKPNSPTVRVGEKGAYSGWPPLAHKTGGEPPNMYRVPRGEPPGSTLSTFWHAFRPTAEAASRNFFGQPGIKRSSSVVQDAPRFGRRGGNSSSCFLRVKDSDFRLLESCMLACSTY